MAINGKSKGSGQERLVAKQLTLWASGQSKDLWFWRMPASGGMSKLYKDLSGDIVALVPEAEPFTKLFSVEIKCHKDVDILDYWNKSSKINSFWSQCCNDAKTANKWPLLIMKVTHRNTFIGFGNNIELNISNCINIIYNDKDNLKLYLLEDFLTNITYNDIIELYKEKVYGLETN
jgi:hypothetical protein